jgi:hypothetical protein
MVAATDTSTDALGNVDGNVDDDPHAPKVAADDPRLRVVRPQSRVLKMKPVIGAIAAILAVGAYTVLASVRRNDEPHEVSREPAKVPDRPPAVPAFIQEAPSTPAPPPAPPFPPATTAAPAPPARAPFEPPPRLDPGAQQAFQQELARQAELARAEAEARNSGLFFAASAPVGSGAPAPHPPQPSALPISRRGRMRSSTLPRSIPTTYPRRSKARSARTRSRPRPSSRRR